MKANLWHLASFTQRNGSKVHASCGMNQSINPFYGRMVSHYMAVSHLFIRSFVDGHLGCFHLLTVVSGAAVNIYVQDFFEYLFSVMAATYQGAELLGQVIILCLSS